MTNHDKGAKGTPHMQIVETLEELEEIKFQSERVVTEVKNYDEKMLMSSSEKKLSKKSGEAIEKKNDKKQGGINTNSRNTNSQIQGV